MHPTRGIVLYFASEGDTELGIHFGQSESWLRRGAEALLRPESRRTFLEWQLADDKFPALSVRNGRLHEAARPSDATASNYAASLVAVQR